MAIPSRCSRNSQGARGRFTSRNTKTKLSKSIFIERYFASAKPVPELNGISSKWAELWEMASKCRARLWKSCIGWRSNPACPTHENKRDCKQSPPHEPPGRARHSVRAVRMPFDGRARHSVRAEVSFDGGGAQGTDAPYQSL